MGVNNLSKVATGQPPVQCLATTLLSQPHWRVQHITLSLTPTLLTLKPLYKCLAKKFYLQDSLQASSNYNVTDLLTFNFVPYMLGVYATILGTRNR